MSIITFGREPGYPKTRIILNGNRLVRTYDDRFKIQVDNDGDYGITILQQLPASLQVGFDYGFGMKVREQNLERDKTARNLHYLNLSIDDQISDQDNQDKDKPPDQRKAKWSWDFETLEHALTVDMDGKPIQSSAYDPIEVTDEWVIPVLTVDKSQPSFDPDTILNYVNHTNQGTFWGAPPKTALMAGIRDREGEVFGGVAFRSVSYTIKFAIPFEADKLEGWTLLLVDHGPNKRVFSSPTDLIGTIEAIKDANGSKITANLNATGEVLAPGAIPHILKFKKKKQADFSPLNINWPL